MRVDRRGKTIERLLLDGKFGNMDVVRFIVYCPEYGSCICLSRPDPLTRDLIHLINARRHDHGDTDAAIDTLQAFLEQEREKIC